MDSFEVNDRTFKVNFSSDGVTKLRGKIKEKLKEFMGDYTDDTLVEYVIVLLRNGRRHEESVNELNVFLGDDSNSFVSWLWDHLSSNLPQYCHSDECCEDEESRRLNIDLPGERHNSLPKSRRSREWNSVSYLTDAPALTSSDVIHPYENEQGPFAKKGRRRSRKHFGSHNYSKKHSSHVDHHHRDKNSVSEASTVAPRRLLQFAVRDALSTYRPSNVNSEPSLKRPHSLLSSSIKNPPADNLRQRLKSIARVPNPLSTSLQAVSDASEDVKRPRSSVNVFDRLGSRTKSIQSSDYRSEDIGEHPESREFSDDKIPKYEGDFKKHNVRHGLALESESGLASNSLSDDDGYGDDIDVGSHDGIGDASKTIISNENKTDNSLLVQYSVSKKGDEIVKKTRNTDQDQLAEGSNASRKIVNISVNVNTWKPPHYPVMREQADSTVQKLVDGTVNNSVRQITREIHNSMKNESEMTDSQKDARKSSNAFSVPCSISPSSEDQDSRTVFVSNVHFGANKETLARHFNKFGEVLKVVILTDLATRQPKGAAYVEFSTKQAAELALSLDGTSFMSRIVKIVRSSGNNEAATDITVGFQQAIRGGAPFCAASKYCRGGGGAGGFRGSPSVKRGARSLQWKREKGTEGKPTRALTYVRAEAKPNT